MAEREHADDLDGLGEDERLVCELLGTYIERRIRGEPHGGISLLRIARWAGREVEQKLAALMRYYDAHRDE
jgi:hypothetical protein